jgi:phospholipase C
LQALTNRDKHANTFKHLFSLTTPRTDTPKRLPDPAHSGIICEGDVAAAVGATGTAVGSALGAGASSAVLSPDPAHAAAPVDTSLSGFVHVAFLRDMHLSPPEEKEQQTAKYLSIQTNADAQQYMDEVRQKVNAYKATMGTQEKM